MGYVVGLTGGIGSGKSTVAHRFAALGANLSDADEVSHRITEKGAPGWHAIAAEFGPAYFTAEGELDRAKLRQAVFSEPALKVRLESILHPLIGAAMQSALAAWRAPYGILMVPLLLESGRYRDRIDRLREHYRPARTDIPISVRIDHGASDAFTVVEVGAADRLGLLFDLARTFSGQGLDVHVAKVATYGPRVVDVFYVTDATGSTLTAAERSAELERALAEAAR